MTSKLENYIGTISIKKDFFNLPINIENLSINNFSIKEDI